MCVQVPDHLEPGLDDKQLTRLLGLDLQGAERTPEPPERPRKRAGLTDLSPGEVQLQLEKQKDNSKWHNLVEGNLILKQGLVDKRKVRPQFHAFTFLLLYGLLCTLKPEDLITA
jgi:3-phosphoinositide dependent protein kinase-1